MTLKYLTNLITTIFIILKNNLEKKRKVQDGDQRIFLFLKYMTEIFWVNSKNSYGCKNEPISTFLDSFEREKILL